MTTTNHATFSPVAMTTAGKAQYHQGTVNQAKRFSARLFHWLFTFPDAVDTFVNHHVHPQKALTPLVQQTTLQRYVRNPALKTAQWLSNKLLRFDYMDHLTIRIGKKAIRIAQPPTGSFFLTIIPLTIIPRLYQASKRAKDPNDRVEFFDILRRDLLTLFFMLYALDPIKAFFTQKVGKRAGIQLVDAAGHVLSPQQTQLVYGIQSPHKLKDFLSQPGNTPQALQKSLLADVQLWRQKAPANSPLQKTLVTLEQHVQALVQNGTQDAHTVENLSDSIFKGIQQAESMTKELAVKATKAEQKQLGKQFPALSESLVRLANSRRTAVSLPCFLFVTFLIGLFPDIFNDAWNRKHHGTKTKDTKPAGGQSTMQTLTPFSHPMGNTSFTFPTTPLRRIAPGHFMG